MKKQILNILKISLFALPFVLGFIGYIQLDGITPAAAAYAAIQLYILQGSLEENSVLLAIARYMAVIVTFSALVLLIKTIFERLTYSIRATRANSCSVYGENESAEALLKNLGADGIKGDIKRPYKSKYHIVMADDNEKAVFYGDALSESAKKSKLIILCLSGVSTAALHSDNIISFSLEENCASDYWNKNIAFTGEKIALVGDGELLEAMLIKGLLCNIRSSEQKIEYHIWSKSDSFIKARSEMDNAVSAANDRLIYHDGDVLADCIIMSEMDRVILCGDESFNITCASKLLELAPLKNVHIYGKNKSGIERLFDSQLSAKILSFGSADELLTFENIVHEKLLETAKKINLYYKEKYGGRDWNELDVFVRKSNISAAEFFPVIRQLANKGISAEKLSEFEHIRWCRLYWLNNWHYGEKRDNKKREHNDLRPYSELTRAEKDKDLENVSLALNSDFIYR